MNSYCKHKQKEDPLHLHHTRWTAADISEIGSLLDAFGIRFHVSIIFTETDPPALIAC